MTGEIIFSSSTWLNRSLAPEPLTAAATTAAPGNASLGGDLLDLLGVDPNSCVKSPLYDVAVIALFVLGAIGNALAVAVMSRPSLRARSFSVSLIVLATFNSLALLVEAISAVDKLVLEKYESSLEEHIGPIGCKVYRYTPTVISVMDHWVVVFITTERFVAVCFPHSLGKMSSNRNSGTIFMCMFIIVALTQAWRPFFDTQDPRRVELDAEGQPVNVVAAVCTANPLGLYVTIDSFLYQLALLFFFPAVSILIMNTAVIARLYMDEWHRARRMRMSALAAKGLPFVGNQFRQRRGTSKFLLLPCCGSVADPPEGSSSFTLSPETQRSNGLSAHHSPASSAAAQDARIRKVTLLLLTITCSFLLYITPHLTLLLYVRFHHLTEGGFAGYLAFLRVCRALNVTDYLAKVSYADNFLIQIIWDEKFRKEFKLLCYSFFGRCCPLFRQLYENEKERERRKKASRYVQTSTAFKLAQRRRPSFRDAAQSPPSVDDSTLLPRAPVAFTCGTDDD